MRSTRMYLPGLAEMAIAAREYPYPESLVRAFSRSRPLPSAGTGTQDAPRASRAIERLYQQLLQTRSPCPRAALMRLGEGRDPGNDLWVIGQPVNLRADLNSVYLMDAAPQDLSAAQLDALHESLAGLFSEAGQRFERSDAEACWYLAPGESLAGRHAFDDPRSCLGRDLGQALPRGEHYAPWHRLMNETQMALHRHEVNQARQAHGLPPVSSLWFWGAGRLPVPQADQPGLGQGARLSGKGLLAAGLARLAGMQHIEAPPGALPDPSGDGDLWCLYQPDYRQFAVDALKQLGSDWLEPALADLEDGRIEALELHTDHGIALHLTRRDWRRWWHRKRELRAVLGIDPP